MIIVRPVLLFAGAAIVIAIAVAGNRQAARIALAQIAEDNAALCAKFGFLTGSTANASCANDIDALLRRHEQMRASEF